MNLFFFSNVYLSLKCPFSFFPKKSTCFKHKPSVQTERKKSFPGKKSKMYENSRRSVGNVHIQDCKTRAILWWNSMFCLCLYTVKRGKKTLRAEAFHHHHCIMMKKENERDILLPFAGACFGARVRWAFYELSTCHCKSELLDKLSL